MPSFEKILKRGKDIVVGKETIESEWKRYIGVVLHHLQLINEIYDDKETQNVAITKVACDNCKKATYLVSAGDPKNPSQVFQFNLIDWKRSNANKILCPDCK